MRRLGLAFLLLALPCTAQDIQFKSASGGTQASLIGTTSVCSIGAVGTANGVCLGSNAITGEGATADTSETVLAFGNATADQTLTCTGAASSLGCVVAAPATAASSTAGNALALTASAATAGDTNAGAAAGGSVTITAGNAARLSTGSAAGGDINLVTGSGIGTGVAGSVVVPAGTAAAPAIRSADADTGIYFPAATRAVQISSDGTAYAEVGGTNASFAVTGPLRVTVSAPNGAIPAAAFFALSVETVATTKAPARNESLELYTNGADVDGQAITLPDDPTAGACYEFALTSTDTSNSMAIAPSAGETLMDAATTCSTSFSATAKGATARICAVSGGSGGLWLVMSKNGTWTCS